MLFNFHIFVNFSDFFLVLTSNFIVVKEHTWYDFSPFKCIVTRSVTRCMVDLGKCVMCF